MKKIFFIFALLFALVPVAVSAQDQPLKKGELSPVEKEQLANLEPLIQAAAKETLVCGQFLNSRGRNSTIKVLIGSLIPSKCRKAAMSILTDHDAFTLSSKEVQKKAKSRALGLAASNILGTGTAPRTRYYN